MRHPGPMALLHAATITPTKQEAIVAWLPSQPWAVGVDAGTVTLVGAYRFNDPAGEVGLETHLVDCGDVVLQVPLTYRAASLDGADPALVCTMEHSALGTRWVYDGCADPAYTTMLAAATLTGVGQSAQVVEVDGRVLTWSPTVRLGGGGWTTGRFPISGLGAAEDDGDQTVLRGPDLELRLVRRLGTHQPPDGADHLTGTWPGQAEPVLLATATPV